MLFGSTVHLLSSFSPYFQLNQAASTMLLKLSVSDSDSPKNGPPFEFRIVSGNKENSFSLDQTGTLRSNRVFDPEAPREFTLEIQVSYRFFWVFFFLNDHIFRKKLTDNYTLFAW